MLSLFRPRPPIDTREKTWVEWRLKWILEEFGADTILHRPVVPLSDLPMIDGRDESEIRRLMEWLADRMQVDHSTIELEIVDASILPNANGTWTSTENGSRIRVSSGACGDIVTLTKVLSHELAHQRLLGEGRISPDVIDHEPLTDLLATAFGLGICVANATVTEQFHRDNSWYTWQISRSGYLTAAVLGYAHAVLAWLRDDRRPAWAKEMRLDARSAFHQGLRYLRRTNDSLLTPDNVRQTSSLKSTYSLLDDLREGTPTRRMAALWELEQRPNVDSNVLTEIQQRMHDRDPGIQCAAIATFGRLAEPDQAADELLHRMGDARLSIQLAAATALCSLASIPDNRRSEVEMLLRKSRDPRVWDAAAFLLSRFGTAAESSGPLLIAPLIHALNACRHSSIMTLIAAIDALTNDPIRFLKAQLEPCDDELYRQAVAALGDYLAAGEREATISDDSEPSENARF